MSYVVRLSDFSPSPRDDGLPWTGAVLYEALTPEASGAQIDDFDFATDVRVSPLGLDVDPQYPSARSFTSTLATLPAGWYRITFRDAAGLLEPTDAVYKGGPITPSTRQVAQFIRARTIVNGGEQGYFDAATSPTDDQVESYIQTATADVISTVGRYIPPEAQDIARQVIAIGTAMVIEVGSEDVNESRYDRLASMYETRLARLTAAVLDAGGVIVDPLPTDPGLIFSGPPYPLGLITGRGNGRDWD